MHLELFCDSTFGNWQCRCIVSLLSYEYIWEHMSLEVFGLASDDNNALHSQKSKKVVKIIYINLAYQDYINRDGFRAWGYWGFSPDMRRWILWAKIKLHFICTLATYLHSTKKWKFVPHLFLFLSLLLSFSHSSAARKTIKFIWKIENCQTCVLLLGVLLNEMPKKKKKNKQKLKCQQNKATLLFVTIFYCFKYVQYDTLL